MNSNASDAEMDIVSVKKGLENTLSHKNFTQSPNMH